MLRPNNRREPRAGARNHLLLLCVFVSCTLLGLFALDAAAQKSAEKKKKPDGLELELVEGGELAVPEEAKKETPSKPLGEKETQAVIARLGKTAPEAKEEKFAFPSSTLPPPVTGTKIRETFPPPQKVPGIKVPANAEIEVLRYQPEGSLPLASHLSVTFSEAMVALDTHESLAGEELPVILTPPVKGIWRWVGTKTLFFEPGGTKGKTRFPMASIYKVEIPGGTRSAGGAKLKKKISWTFSTPAPTIVSAHPQGGPKRINPVMVLVFDQKINPEAVLEYITVRTAAKKYALRRATEADLAADARAKKVFSAAAEDRRVAFLATEHFPTSSTVQIQAGKGLPSLEGPLKTTKEQAFSFRTFAPLKVTQHQCYWNNYQKKECPPGQPMLVYFNNQIDAKVFDPSQVKIEPALDGKQVNIHGNRLHIHGRTRPRTAYAVTLKSSIKDVFSQELGKEVSLAFSFGKMSERLSSNSGSLMVTDPAGPPKFSIYTINHDTVHLDAYRVNPGQWSAYNHFLREYRKKNSKAVPPGEKLYSGEIDIKGAPDELTETAIDLRPVFEELGGQVILVIRKNEKAELRTAVIAWAQRSSIAIDAFVDSGKLLVWTSALADGATLEGVEVKVSPHGLSGRSNKSGLVSFELPKKNSGSGVITAKKGAELAFLPETTSWWSRQSNWQARPQPDSYAWHVFDDRGMYRPGEEVRIKGWVRRVVNSLGGDLEPLPKSLRRLSYKVRGPRGNEFAKGELNLSELGGFHLSFRLPLEVNLGYANVSFAFLGVAGRSPGRHGHGFQVQEFRRPEFEVKAEKSPGPHIVLGQATATVTAAYYAGGPLPDAPVSWVVTQAPASYSPPGHGDFTFGTWVPWWRFGDHRGGFFPGGRSAPTSKTFTGKTDGLGLHRLGIHFKAVTPPRPTSVEARASVSDVNRQTWASSTTILVHPADLYVGLRSEKTFVDEGKPLEIEAIVTDIDGKLMEGRAFELLCIRQRWAQEKGTWLQKEEIAARKNMTSAKKAVEARFAGLPGGSYLLRAVIADEKKRKNQSQLTLWIAGEKRPENRRLEQEVVTLIPDKKEYKAGETARVLAQLPFSPAEAVITLRRSGIVETRRLRIAKGTHTIEIPIREDMVPGISVQVDLVGSAKRIGPGGKPDKKLPARPAYASGRLALTVPPYSRTLAVKATPGADRLIPGGETFVKVEVHDANNKPVKDAEVAVVVVDEAILALTGYKLANPLQSFYRNRGDGVRDYRFRGYVQLREFVERLALLEGRDEAAEVEMMADSMQLGAPGGRAGGMRMRSAKKGLMANAAAFGASDKDGGGAEAISMRSNFSALALFAAKLPTDADGTAQVKLKLPDSLTRYRIMAVGVAGSRQFGSGESSITAELPLMVRPSPPRFLNYGDRCELPVVIQNRTEKPIEVQVALRGANIKLLDGAGRKVTVPASDRAEVRFPVAAVLPGTARFQVAAVSGKLSDAADVELPVWTPATTEAFATYGQIDGSQPGQNAVVQTVAAPANVVPGFGGLEVTTSSTTLHALTDAYIYLAKYPYGCAEQVASRVLVTAALRDVLAAFKAEGLPDARELIATVGRDIKRLQGLQYPDGGFGWWNRKYRSNPYLSVHVIHALARARQKDFTVPEVMVRRAQQYLLNIDKHIPKEYPEMCRTTIKAYSLYVAKALSGKKGPGGNTLTAARLLLGDTPQKKMPLEAAGWLLTVLAGDPKSQALREATLKRFGQLVVETASTAQFTTSYADGAHLLLHSSRRTDAIILEAMINTNPQSDLVPKLVKGLLAHRVRGRWGNTQENAFVLLSLDRYFQVFEADEPYFVARAWLGKNFAGQHEFEGRNTDYHHISIPMTHLDKKKSLVLSKEGKGRLYYRLGLRYAPAKLELEPSDHGFTIQRRYEAIDDPGDVKREKDGSWKIKLGAKVRAVVTMVAPARRYHVALTDPLPAGLEPLNPALAVTGGQPTPPPVGITPRRGGWWWRGTWYQHQNLRDDRAEAFSSLVWAGVHSYSYVARATTPGTFVVPPAKAEEMYQPETFGRSSSAKVIIE